MPSNYWANIQYNTDYNSFISPNLFVIIIFSQSYWIFRHWIENRCLFFVPPEFNHFSLVCLSDLTFAMLLVQDKISILFVNLSYNTNDSFGKFRPFTDISSIQICISEYKWYMTRHLAADILIEIRSSIRVVNIWFMNAPGIWQWLCRKCTQTHEHEYNGMTLMNNQKTQPTWIKICWFYLWHEMTPHYYKFHKTCCMGCCLDWCCRFDITSGQ